MTTLLSMDRPTLSFVTVSVQTKPKLKQCYSFSVVSQLLVVLIFSWHCTSLHPNTD